MDKKHCTEPFDEVKKLEISSILECLYNEYREHDEDGQIDEGVENAFIRMLSNHIEGKANLAHIKILLRKEYQKGRNKEYYVKRMFVKLRLR